MIVLTDDGRLVLAEATSNELAMLDGWIDGCPLTLAADGDTWRLAPARPINITYDDAPMPLQLISNLAQTPFVLDDRPYASIEGFWQGLKFPDETDRQRIASLSGPRAKRAGDPAPKSDVIAYGGKPIRVGTIDHWELMERACRAKFEQCGAARDALLSTGQALLEHKVKVDSRTIPGVVMADIWMRIRADLRRQAG